MAKMQSKKRHTLSPRTVFFFILSAIIFFILLTAVVNLGKKYIDLKDKLHGLEEEKTTLERKKEELGEENSYLATPEGEEHILREKYQLVKPGEGMVVITGPETDTSTVYAPKKGITKVWDSILRGLGIRH